MLCIIFWTLLIGLIVFPKIPPYFCVLLEFICFYCCVISLWADIPELIHLPFLLIDFCITSMFLLIRTGIQCLFLSISPILQELQGVHIFK